MGREALGAAVTQSSLQTELRGAETVGRGGALLQPVFRTQESLKFKDNLDCVARHIHTHVHTSPPQKKTYKKLVEEKKYK